MSNHPLHCPYTNLPCKLEERYDMDCLSVEIMAKLQESFATNRAMLLEAMKIAQAKVYLGESCQTCGAFFPCTTERNTNV